MKKIILSSVLFLSLINVPVVYGQLSADSINYIIKWAVDNKRSPGMAVGVINADGRQVFSYGKVKDNSDAKPDGNTLYEIGSITKTFTTLLLADMVSKGEVNLNDPISKFLPKSVKTPTRNGKEITLLDLATHTSGLPRIPNNMKPKDPNDPYADYTPDKLYDFLSHYTLTRDIGSKYEYSNLGMGLLGHILSLAAGTDYETLVKTRICEPLKMNSTEITLDADMQKRLATPYDNGNVVKNWTFSCLAPCGAIRSSVNDLLNYAAANLGLTDTKLTPAIKLTQITRDSIGPGLDIGLGWHIWKKYGRKIYWHDGNTSGYYCYIGYDLDSKTAVVVLSNSAARIDDIALHIIEPKFPLPHVKSRVVQVPDAAMKKYCGLYKKNNGTVRAITSVGNSLYYSTDYSAQYGEMKFTSATDFFTEMFPSEFSIAMDSLGNVTGLKIKGGEVFAKRVDRVKLTDTLNLSINQYTGLGWDALRNKDYNNAFTYFQKGLKIDSTNLGLLENLAHAYLFTGNYTQSIKIYKKYRGQNINLGFSWDAAIKSDFTSLKADGLPAEPMDKVLQELGLGGN